MRPILVEIPSKPLFFIALGLAAALLLRDVWRRRRDPKNRLGATPLYLVAAALAIVKLRSPAATLLPSAATFQPPWLPVPIFAYGVMLGTSMVIGWFLAMRFAKQDGIPTEYAAAIYLWTALFSIVGARILYVIVWWRNFAIDPIAIVKINQGGMVAYGGMIGGFLASWYGCRKRGIPLLQWADVSAPSVVLGTAITRVGCLLFGCDFGRRTNVPWALTFPGPNPMAPGGSPAWEEHVQKYGLPHDALRSFPVHPTQVYEMLVGLALFGLLMYLRRRRRFSGEVFVGWVIGYGVLRPLIEILRDDDQRGGLGIFSTSQIIGVIAASLGVALLVHLVRRYRRDPESLRLWERPILVAEPAVAVAGAGAGRGGAAARSAGGSGGGGGSGRRRKKRR